MHLNDMSDDLISLVWYTRDEYSAIRRQNAQTIKLMSKRGSALVPSDTIYCTRGLENRIRLGSQRKNELRIITLIAILGEQERLQENSITGDVASQALANVYSNISIEAQSAAFLRGLKDEQDAEDYLRNSSSSSPKLISPSTTNTTWDQNSFGWSSMESICLDEEEGDENQNREETSTDNIPISIDTTGIGIGSDDNRTGRSEIHQIEPCCRSQCAVCGVAA